MPNVVEGKVGIIESNPGLLGLFKILVTLSKHKVHLEASTFQEAKLQIEQRVHNLGSLALDAVLLDGDIKGEQPNENSAEIARRLREASNHNLLIISMSEHNLFTAGADMELSKHYTEENPDGPVHVVKALEGYLSTLSETSQLKRSA